MATHQNLTTTTAASIHNNSHLTFTRIEPSHQPAIMAENIPPGSAGKAAAATSESTVRGLPYYEKLRRDLRDTLQKEVTETTNIDAK